MSIETMGGLWEVIQPSIDPDHRGRHRNAYTCTRRSTICDQLWQLGLLCVKVDGLLGDVEGYP